MPDHDETTAFLGRVAVLGSVPSARPSTSPAVFWAALRGRQNECKTLAGLVAAVQANRSQVLVLRGEAGIGKTALLDFLVEGAGRCQLGRAAGVESELELPYAGLHQLCGPYLDRLDSLPLPQRDALRTVFGLQGGGAPDRFLVGLAALTLLAGVAEEQPLICVIDDAQWLDQASAQALEFVARRLDAEPLGLVFAVRETDQEPKLAGLPELQLRGLGTEDAAALLESAVPGTLDPRVRDRILAESNGNPLALLELPRVLTAAELAFGTAAARSTGPLINRLEQGFIRQLASLPPQTRLLLLVAAAEPVGDIPLLWRAAEELGIEADVAATAEEAGLIEFHDRVRFRHPLVRSAMYQSATPAERRQVHRALADATDAEASPDRHAWHRASAALGPDEAVAAELESSADRAVSLGGLAAAAAFHETAASLTPDPIRRAQRSLAAAQAKAGAGAFEDAYKLLAFAQSGPLAEAELARVDLLRAQISYNSIHGNQALPLMLAAARRFESLDGAVARGTYLDALSAALFAGRLAPGPGPGMRQVAQAARTAPRAEAPSKADLLLEGMAILYTDGYVASAGPLHRAIQAFGSEDLTVEEAFRSAWVAAVAAVDLWDDVHWDVLSRRHLEVVRKAGALSLLPLALASRAIFDIHSGNLAAAGSLVAESNWIAEVTGGENVLTPIPASWLAAMRGHESQAGQLIQATINDATASGQGVGLTMMNAARALLCNGLGRYDDALVAAQEAATEPLELGPTKWALAELVEAGVRSGKADVAAGAFDLLSEMTRASGTDYALGVAAARGALLRDGDSAEELYREAIDRLGRTRIQVELARARLLYGEWLRRRNRRADARCELRTAHESFSAMGVEAFAERARRELAATGETVRRRTVETQQDLTDQEGHIARLAAEGLSNPEIAAALYLSRRTVEWHLRKVFSKLGVTTRRQLRRHPSVDQLGMPAG
ncbi:LuxR family transcriptional regulator [Streptomyces sp. SID13031]|uniref:ATP-binding protein n=1 Tax=Streptomyces sp. SID13031 TaxID=2706046 RepID=UPI0013C981AD|nr:LuxR family transcriptional regulator [Streptomyces sp. SID13031]NEA36852.1 helix-turn-helix domain-containing protein [Streptomyces sp. SID13031]